MKLSVNKESQWTEEYKGFPKLLIWYYRVIGITFGGIQVKANNQFVSNKWLRYYGHLTIVGMTVIYSLAIHSYMNDSHHILIYNNGHHFIYYLTGSLLALDITQVVINHLFLNWNAIRMVESISRYGFAAKYSICCILVFCAALVIRLGILALAVKRNTLRSMLCLTADKLIVKPAIDCSLFLSLSFSVSISQYYRVLRLSLNNNDITYETIARIRQSFVKTRKLIHQLDQSMTLCQIVTISHAMINLMIEIYFIANHKTFALNTMVTYYLVSSIESAIRLIVICLINGMVYEETDQLLFALEDIKYAKDNCEEKAFRELMTFRTLNWNLPNGFTIGGLMPLRRTTLLTIFSFILTYAVILIQTGAH